jgi:protoporphyrinogen oxidase
VVNLNLFSRPIGVLIIKRIRVAVIGAGPAGLSAAYSLQEKGFEVQLFESSGEVGGMARSVWMWDQIVDIGPHRFFSSDPRVNRFWLSALDSEYVMVKRLTRIYYNKRFFSYPIQAMNALQGLGVFEAAKCVISYLAVKVRPKTDESKFDNWVINRFGSRLFEIFFKSYTEKLWGIRCSELDADFAAQRIKKLSMYEAIKSTLLSANKSKHRTLVDEFAYPKFGAGYVYTKLATKFHAKGGKLVVNSRITNIQLSHEGVALTANGEISSFDHLISSMPITNLIRMIGAPESVLAASEQLRFRNTILVYLKVSGSNPFPDQWIYVHAEELLTGRITNFSNWTSTIKKDQEDHIICLEYWCYDESSIWIEKDDYLVSLGTEELYKTGLVRPGAISEGKVIRVPKCYPVYSTGYKDLLQPVQDFLNTLPRVTPIGRYGSFKYNNQDHSILMGLLAAENLADGTNYDLWGINTDYEYQESTRITSTGLISE